MCLALVGWCVPELQARSEWQQGQILRNTSSRKAGRLSPVAQKLDEAGYFTTSTARPDARFYIFICSASWCGPCRALMPEVVKEYENNMKRDKSVSMVLLGCDDTKEAAQKYIEHYETDMPGVLKSAVSLEKAPQIAGIPWYFILDSEGNLVSSGAGSRVLAWKEILAQAKTTAPSPPRKKNSAPLAERKKQCKSWHARNMNRTKRALAILSRVKDEESAEKAKTSLRALFEDEDGNQKDECPDSELYEELYPMEHELVNSYGCKLGRMLHRISVLVEEEDKVNAYTYDELEEICKSYTRYYTMDEMPETKKSKQIKWKRIYTEKKKK